MYIHVAYIVGYMVLKYCKYHKNPIFVEGETNAWVLILL